jgi:hypothetical protein
MRCVMRDDSRSLGFGMEFHCNLMHNVYPNNLVQLMIKNHLARDSRNAVC